MVINTNYMPFWQQKAFSYLDSENYYICCFVKILNSYRIKKLIFGTVLCKLFVINISEFQISLFNQTRGCGKIQIFWENRIF